MRKFILIRTYTIRPTNIANVSNGTEYLCRYAMLCLSESFKSYNSDLK